MRIRFTQEITLPCVTVWPVEYDGEPAELDMECQVVVRAGEEFDKVEIDDLGRLWLRDDLVALAMPREAWEEILR